MTEERSGGIDELCDAVEALTKRIKGGELGTQQGVTYLETKAHLLLSYMTGTMLATQLQGPRVGEVRQRVAKLRTMLDKLRPLDAKLKHEIAKLVREATVGSAPVAAGGVSVKGGARETSQDPLQFRPRMDDLEDGEDDGDAKDVVKGEDDDGDEDESEIEEDEEETSLKKAPKSNQKSKQMLKEAVVTASSNKYVVPKFMPVPYEVKEKLSAKRDREEQRIREKLKQSRMLKEIGQQFTDRPVEIEGDNIESIKLRNERLERTRFEEENFVRLSETKAQRKARMGRERLANDDIMENGRIDEMEDYEQFSKMMKTHRSRGRDLDEVPIFEKMQEKKKGEGPRERKGLAKIVNEMEEEGRKNRRGGGGDRPTKKKKSR